MRRSGTLVQMFSKCAWRISGRLPWGQTRWQAFYARFKAGTVEKSDRMAIARRGLVQDTMHIRMV
jgi:hypothetical protein